MALTLWDGKLKKLFPVKTTFCLKMILLALINADKLESDVEILTEMDSVFKKIPFAKSPEQHQCQCFGKVCQS